MLKIGVQTKNIVYDDHPEEGFVMMRRAGFLCADFSLNGYLSNGDIYGSRLNDFFDDSIENLKSFFKPHRDAAKETGVKIHQMHMPYPIFVPNVDDDVNDYLKNVVAQKSMELCAFFDCKYIVIHGFKLASYLGSESAEWERTEEFLDFLAPLAKELNITMCIENLYNALGNHMTEGPACDMRSVAERIDRINDRYGAEILGFCFDSGHANLVGLDLESFITHLGKRLKVLHIHDNDGRYDLHQIPFTFTRTRENTASTDWDGFIRGLKNIDFRGVLSFETAPVLSSFPAVMKQDVLSFIARIGEYMSGEIVGSR